MGLPLLVLPLFFRLGPGANAEESLKKDCLFCGRFSIGDQVVFCDSSSYGEGYSEFERAPNASEAPCTVIGMRGDELAFKCPYNSGAHGAYFCPGHWDDSCGGTCDVDAGTVEQATDYRLPGNYWASPCSKMCLTEPECSDQQLEASSSAPCRGEDYWYLEDEDPGSCWVVPPYETRRVGGRLLHGLSGMPPQFASETDENFAPLCALYVLAALVSAAGVWMAWQRRVRVVRVVDIVQRGPGVGQVVLRPEV